MAMRSLSELDAELQACGACPISFKIRPANLGAWKKASKGPTLVGMGAHVRRDLPLGAA